jgi:hypothetical protein
MCGKRTRQRRAPDVTIFVHGVQVPAACPNRTMSRIMLSVLSDCGEVGQQSKLMTSLGAWNGKNILEDERTWAKGRQASMPATRPSKRDHSTNIAAHGLDCSPTRPGSWEPDLRGFDAQWRDQLKMDSGCWASKGIIRRLERLAPKVSFVMRPLHVFAVCGSLPFAAEGHEAQHSVNLGLLSLRRSQRVAQTVGLSTPRLALHLENQFWCSDIIPQADDDMHDGSSDSDFRTPACRSQSKEGRAESKRLVMMSASATICCARLALTQNC